MARAAIFEKILINGMPIGSLTIADLRRIQAENEAEISRRKAEIAALRERFPEIDG